MDLEKENRWPIVLPLYDDEVLSSWIIRNSIANGSDPISFTGALWNNWRCWSIDIDTSISITQLSILSKASKISIKKLYTATLKPFKSDTKKTMYQSWIIPLGSRNRVKTNGYFFCSECIKENRSYMKRGWRFAWSISCSKHKILLSQACPKCNFPFSPHLIKYYATSTRHCQHCGYDLANSKNVRVKNSLFNFQENLDNAATPFLLNTNTYNEQLLLLRTLITFIQRSISRPKSFNNFLKEMSISEKIDLSHFPFERKSIEERYLILNILTKICLMTLNELISTLKKSKVTKTMFIQQTVSCPTIEHIVRKLSHSGKPRKVKAFIKNQSCPTPEHIVDDMMIEILDML
ncbi:TniQ family protein [Francisella philomiragia]|uniref:TniQ family protein n=1 Tax=Francisella philomiragia TaxID=28110 RepID=A0AAW3DB00_9GAMM|nr:TniQ family protein [Francisella philomiragia]KFJ42698.1 tniQ family protein [Francisella philomiragia]MBK2254637.1 TniQ family protein [Francisella philomiragia]MBK2273006.1 TniQ family protein [Francisella philomiragia]MBK2276847.1 TniQ family protein [Francisella philomiragia]MBK2280559.1 TniQ family protein [Francisella philomiragia]